MELDLSKYIRKKTTKEFFDENNNFENFSTNPNIETRNIKDYFDNCNVFVTGSTGFLGKVLIEKLLRTCDGIEKIYILLRPKRGVESEQRFEEYLRNPIFERIRAKNSEVLSKLVCIPGDIKDSDIGLSDSDAKFLEENIHIVFHVAATVRFNEPLREAVNLNTFGTRRIMELCTKMTKLKSLVHVSTAYSNPERRNVGEQVYGSSSSDDHRLFVNGVGVLPDDLLLDTIANRFQKKHPNTYTLTKHMAEQIVIDYKDRLPISIVRPSIVVAAIDEPYSGWIDNVYGITGIVMEVGRGTISSIMGVGEYIVDIIPVDVVCNTMITAAWANCFMRPPNEVVVYNCISGQRNPILWKEMNDKIVKHARKNPSKYISMYPKFRYTTNRSIHFLYEIFLHFFPAFLTDLVLRMQGKKPIMLKISKRFKVAADTGEYFAMHEWNFGVNNINRMTRAAQETQMDANEFNCDISAINWDTFFERYIRGIRQFLLKDDMSSLPKARRKLQKIIWARRVFYFFLLGATLYLLLNFLWN